MSRFYNAEGPPVPIPNTEVKLCSVEDTLLATARENRSEPTRSADESLPNAPKRWKPHKNGGTHKDGGVAQLGEHLPCKQGVMGSNPIISTSRRRSAGEDTEESGTTE